MDFKTGPLIPVDALNEGWATVYNGGRLLTVGVNRPLKWVGKSGNRQFKKVKRNDR